MTMTCSNGYRHISCRNMLCKKPDSNTSTRDLSMEESVRGFEVDISPVPSFTGSP